MKDKRLHKFIAITLSVTLLTFSASKVTRVYALGTTATIAGTAFILTGAVYISYIALTQGQIVLPVAEDLHDWLGDIGRKVSQFSSGAEAYQDIYQQISREPLTNIIDGVWTWTQDRIKSFVNDFSDTRIITDILGYTEFINTSNIPYNGFTYPYTFSMLPTLFAPWIDAQPKNFMTLSQIQDSENCSISFYNGAGILYHYGETYWIMPTSITNPVRNILLPNNYYSAEEYYDGSWHQINNILIACGVANYANGNTKYVMPLDVTDPALILGNPGYMTISGDMVVPLFPQEVIHVQATDEDLPLVIPENESVNLPTWVDPDNDNRPIIPWVPIPELPTDVPVPSGYNGISQWGFNLQDLLDKIEDLAGQLIDIGGIAALINEFAGLHGDNYYLEYNDGDTNFYTYYQPTIYDNDTEYVTYNIDVSHTDEHLPVDLNTIELYTHNHYLDEVRRSAIAGGSIIRDLTVFWYDVDSTIIYIFFGSCIAILVAAFIGKWGHS